MVTTLIRIYIIPKNKNASLSSNLVQRLIFKYAEFNVDALFSHFRPGIPFLGQFGPKIQNCQLKKLIPRLIRINGVAHFLNFWPDIPFLTKFGPRNQNCQIKLKYVICNHAHNILRLFDGWANFALPQVKWSVIISENLVYRSCLTTYRTTKDLRS